jgi:hypothetical protein
MHYRANNCRRYLWQLVFKQWQHKCQKPCGIYGYHGSLTINSGAAFHANAYTVELYGNWDK